MQQEWEEKHTMAVSAMSNKELGQAALGQQDKVEPMLPQQLQNLLILPLHFFASHYQ